MSARAKTKGTEFESMVRDFLRRHGFQAERIPAGAEHDRGDIAGVIGWTLELKNYTDTTRAIREGLADLEVEQENARTKYGAVIYKRRGVRDAGKQLVVMELDQWATLVLQSQERP